MNLGDFRKMTEHLPDSTEFVSHTDNFEMGNSLVKANSVRLIKVKETTRQFRDAFDGTLYSSTVYVPSDEGIEMLKI